ncbi:hypothetical protein CONLIGDRAFT_683638 [Coniochaeta ligniaria NRRL 30616]|uniref:Uncharacterized protein n=1 Tax=Coniochaeta ligniaria NRRL 30616 TaxID=1408157 RepID=A0A1J7IG60_9PEZI|nr:hypothetical protein CONLIGDRAFT_683638 [Coniochaeta ligniaria NRRL 30616]
MATSAEHHRTKDFPKFLNLPFELQLQVWLEVLSEPSINFCDIKTEPIPPEYRTVAGAWHPKLRALSQSHDDSAFRHQQQLAAICPSAVRALRVACRGGREGRELSGRRLWIDRKTHILCLRSLIYPSNLSRISWHCPQDLQSPTADDSPHPVFSGLEKVGIVYKDVVFYPRNWAFPCDGRSFGRHLNATSYCHIQLAFFIDCFPDIQEFFVVVGFQARQDTAGTIQKWCNEHDMKDLAIYRGHKRCYYEIHRGPGASGTGACQCPLTPKCHGNGSVPVDRHIYSLFQDTRNYLLDDTKPWKLSVDRRRSIKFAVLLKGLEHDST